MELGRVFTLRTLVDAPLPGPRPTLSLKVYDAALWPIDNDGLGYT